MSKFIIRVVLSASFCIPLALATAPRTAATAAQPRVANTDGCLPIDPTCSPGVHRG
jgi:hypothetical protein